MYVEPQEISTFAGGRVVLRLFEDSGEWIDPNAIPGVRVELYVPGDAARLLLVSEDGTVTATAPERKGTHLAQILLRGEGVSESAELGITIRSLGGTPVTLSVGPYDAPDTLHADVFDPRGTYVAMRPLSVEGQTVEIEPGTEWIEGVYRVVIREASGRDLDLHEVYVEKANYASAPTFWELPEPARLSIEYLKYDLMGDVHPVPPSALLTLEQYARHWEATVEDIGFAIQVRKRKNPPSEWYPVILKGTTVRAFDTLANRAVTVPRFTGVPTVAQTEDHLQGAWETRKADLKREYDRDKYLVRRYHMPGAGVTIDPFLSMFGRGFGGRGLSSAIGRPSWFPAISDMARR